MGQQTSSSMMYNCIITQMITIVTSAMSEVFSLVWLVINSSSDNQKDEIIAYESSPFKITKHKTLRKSNEDNEESWGQFIDLSEESCLSERRFAQ